MKQLVLITSHYPYETGESFLEAEMEQLGTTFQKITIVTEPHAEGTPMRPIPANCTVLTFQNRSSARQILGIPLLILRHLGMVCRLFQKECSIVRHTYHLSFSWAIFKQMVHDAIKGLQWAQFLSRHFDPKDCLFYAYWLKSTAIGLAMLRYRNPEATCISRAHGHDLYFEVHATKYIAFQSFKAQQLHRIYFISDQGRAYFKQRLPMADESHLFVSKLGTRNPLPLSYTPQPASRYTVVTCSNLPSSNVKRIPLLIEALQQVELPITWLHIGTGAMETECRQLASKYLDHHSQITYQFLGNFSNKEVHQFYASHPIDWMMNVSSSEGLPVSLMEAISYGIPILATHVGGTSEICTEETGHLMPKDLTATALAQEITTFVEKKLPHLQCEQIIAFWASHFSAATNHARFAQAISTLAS